MIEIDIDKAIFNDKYLSFLQDTRPLQVFYGGASSGKSVFIAQRSIIDLARGGRNFLVARNVRNTIRHSIFAEWKAAINSLGMHDYFNCNESDLVITCNVSQRQAVFVGLDDAQKLKSIRPLDGPFTDLICEEATEMSEETYNQLVLRMRGESSVPKRRVLLFNPIERRHWICRRFFNNQWIDFLSTNTLLILHSTHRDNKFLSEQDHADIESFKDIDQYYYEVYALGKWGTLGALIFKNWEVRDLAREHFDPMRIRNGLDFGYSNDPTAVVRCAKRNGELFVYWELYEKGLTNPDIADEVKPVIGDEILWCDSAEPKSIRELQLCGLRAKPCKKKVGRTTFGTRSSILHGIQWLQQQRLVIDKRCQNMINEISLAQWQKDRDGNPINVPVDANNHLLDALRYAWSNDMLRGSSGIHVLGGMKDDQ